MNYRQALETYRATIKNSPLYNCLSTWHKEVLESRDDITYSSFEFKRGIKDNESSWGAEATLGLDFKTDYKTYTDDEGNEYGKYTPIVTVNYASYGASDLSVVRERVNMVLDVVALGEAIKAALPSVVTRLERTRAQIEAAEAKRQAAERQEQAEQLVKENSKHLRVGKIRHINLGVTLPEGEYNVTMEARHYSVNVMKDTAVICRQA